MSERLHVVPGCMFAGKSTELMRLRDREHFAGNGQLVVKPSNDTRSAGIRTHEDKVYSAIEIDFNQPEQIFKFIDPHVSAVFIDEAQFFDKGLVRVVEILLHNGIRVYAAGLPTDFRHVGFGPMPDLVVKADNYSIVTAVCTYNEGSKVCGSNATRTQRLINGKYPDWDDPVVMVGAAESYAPRCANHHVVLNNPHDKKLW